MVSVDHLTWPYLSGLSCVHGSCQALPREGELGPWPMEAPGGQLARGLVLRPL